MNISPLNIFQILLLLAQYHQNFQAVLAATIMNGLISKLLRTLIPWVFFRLGKRDLAIE